MKLTYEQKKAYDDYMDALLKLYRVMEPIDSGEIEMIQEEMRDMARNIDETVWDTAPYVFEMRQCEEEDND